MYPARFLMISTLTLLVASPASERDTLAQGPEAPSNPVIKAFEKAFQKSFEQRMDAVEAEERRRERLELLRIKALTGISVDEYRQTWQIDLKANQVPAGSLLEDLAKPLGWTVHRTQETSDALARPVTIDLQAVSHLQAFEQICQEIELTPEYPDPMKAPMGGALVAGMIEAGEQLDPVINTKGRQGDAADDAVTFRVGARSLPVAFAGPCFVRISKLTENTPNATGRLDVTVRAPGLPPAVLAIDQENLAFGKVDKVQSGQGENLMTDVYSGAMVNFPWLARQIALRGLWRDVSTISVQGSCQISVPTEVMTVTFDKLEQGALRSVGEGTVEIASLRPIKRRINGEESEGVRLTLKYENVAAGKPKLVAIDARGNLLPTDGEGVMWSGRSGQVFFSLWGKAKQLVVKLPQQVEKLNYPFKISDIPLQQSDQQPKSLTPLEYGSHAAPVEIEVLSVKEEQVFRKVHARGRNRSNKAVHSVSFTMRYLDENRKELKVHQGQESGIGVDEPLIDPESDSEFEITAFFMPDEATDVELVLKSVRFTDYSEWKSEEDSSTRCPNCGCPRSFVARLSTTDTGSGWSESSPGF